MIGKLFLIILAGMFFALMLFVYGAKNRHVRKVTREISRGDSIGTPVTLKVGVIIVLLLIPLPIYYLNAEPGGFFQNAGLYLFMAWWYGVFVVAGILSVFLSVIGSLFRKTLPIAIETGSRMTDNERQAHLRRTIRYAKVFWSWLKA